MGRTQTYYDLRDELARPGCAVCALRDVAVERFLDILLWQNVNDPGLRRALRRSQGFCHEHAWMLNRSGASLGAAIIMQDVLRQVLATLGKGRYKPVPELSLRGLQDAVTTRTGTGKSRASTAGLVAALGPRAECPVCVRAREREETCLTVLMQHLTEEDGLLPAYRASEGLCLPHFRRALARVKDKTTYDALVGAQQAIGLELYRHLSEALRKSNAQFQDEVLEEGEGDAWLRAIAALTGSPKQQGRA